MRPHRKTFSYFSAFYCHCPPSPVRRHLSAVTCLPSPKYPPTLHSPRSCRGGACPSLGAGLAPPALPEAVASHFPGTPESPIRIRPHSDDSRMTRLNILEEVSALRSN